MNDRDMVARPPRPQGQGSLLPGVACAWGMLIGGYALAIALLNIGTGNGNDGAIVLLLALPWLGMLGLIVWFATTGRPRSALGVLVGIGTIIGVGLLLVAACFGLLASWR
jgi:hypothetical protein